MKTKILALYFFIIFIYLCIPFGCTDKESSLTVLPDENKIIKEFKLYDKKGFEANVFRTGEDFEMRFSITNQTGIDLTYHYSPPLIVFKILQSDTIVCTSIDGLAFIHPIFEEVLLNEESFQDKWIAPNSVARDPRVSLLPGNYKAIVKHGSFFDFAKLKETEPIEFSIVEDNN